MNSIKKGFTLLELLVVIIIIGVLAIIALVQYNSLSERSRTSEIDSVFDGLRKAEWTNFHDTGEFTNDPVALSQYVELPPYESCQPSHWFLYSLSLNCGTGLTSPCFTLTAVRCTSGGKSPNSSRVCAAYFSEDSMGNQAKSRGCEQVGGGGGGGGLGGCSN
ncbi:MAG: prepilin-type N-terminal cleavage/methylation domain-containing protein [Candidatus Omnitrophica bacterium]|nr:prepilin-type N-terminal cleavage/methylation domain-containing protein [Candidatus Omnitrophota bacterium]MDD5611331.1 prepilin-type N-terminal cleavage/methylation domain-containing protein [Candidatus Omnitrophota bacterium]